MPLRALERHDAERLLLSLFGDTPNSAGWAQRLWSLSEGNPKQLLRLAQHLVDHGVVHFEAGAWNLPSAVSAVELPLNASDAQRARAAALSGEARALAIALALCPDLDFSQEECAPLCGPNAGAAIDELRRAEIARVVRERITLGHATWSAVLCAPLTAAGRQRAHQALASALATRSDQTFRVGQQLLLAGEIERALDLLVTHAAQSQEETALSEAAFVRYVRSLPPDWLRVFRDAVRLCEERGRPRSQRFVLFSRLAGILAMQGVDDLPLMAALIRELELDSGLAAWAALDPQLEPLQRLTLALQQTQARFDAAPPEHKNLDPLNAIKQLARGITAISGLAATGMDVRTVRALPSLVPLLPLSVALSLIHLLREGARGAESRRRRLLVSRRRCSRALRRTNRRCTGARAAAARARLLASEIANDTEMTRAADDDTELADVMWSAADGHDYRPVVLGHYAGGQHVIHGIAVLQLSRARPFVYPAAVASELGSFSDIEITTTSAGA